MLHMGQVKLNPRVHHSPDCLHDVIMIIDMSKSHNLHHPNSVSSRGLQHLTSLGHPTHQMHHLVHPASHNFEYFGSHLYGRSGFYGQRLSSQTIAVVFCFFKLNRIKEYILCTTIPLATRR